MVEYPTDLDLDNSKDIHLDAGNDLTLTSGIAQLQQSVALDVLNNVDDFISGQLSGENLGRLETSIRQSLERDPQVGDVRTVTIDSFDRQTGRISVDVTLTKNEDFTLELTNAS